MYDLPSIAKLADKTRQPSITILARDGTKFASVGEYYEAPIKARQLPSHVLNAFIATEDRRFFHHYGIDIIGVLRALYQNVTKGDVIQGGSTITQQLAKNFLLTEGLFHYRDRSLRRKIQEALLSLWLEAKFTKYQILTMYLNRVYFGSGAFGLAAAAKQYYNKSAQNLTLHEAALLAGLLKAPSKYSPHRQSTGALERTRQVIIAMKDANLIDDHTFNTLIQAPLPKLANHHGSLFARYFVDWVIEIVPQLIGTISDDLVVSTTLDIALQKQAEQDTHWMLDQVGLKSQVTQAAMICMTPEGAVRALIGGADYGLSQFNRATQALRQTGSIFKLFVYLAAFEAGTHPSQAIADTPIKIAKWSPKNYGWKSQGTVSVENGFAYSINTVSVRLARSLGHKKIHAMAQRLGVSTPQPRNLAVALGAGEASLLELTHAYACLANQGYAPVPHGITAIRTPKGRLLYRYVFKSQKRLLSPMIVSHMKRLLKAVMDYGTGRSVALQQPSYGKTGTTQKYKDAWFIGFTPTLVTGVWMGNDDNTPMEKVTGAKLPGKLWQRFMQSPSLLAHQ